MPPQRRPHWGPVIRSGECRHFAVIELAADAASACFATQLKGDMSLAVPLLQTVPALRAGWCAHGSF